MVTQCEVVAVGCLILRVASVQVRETMNAW